MAASSSRLGGGAAAGRLSPLSVVPVAPSSHSTALATPGTSKPNKFAVFDLAEDRGEAPKTFHEAAERGNTAWCVRAIERTIDFDVNAKDRLMRTALHWAAEMGHHDTAKTLLDFGCDVRITDCTGRTAVHLAAKSGDAEMLALLLAGLCETEAAALVNQGDHNDITPVFLAVQRGEEAEDAFGFLMQHGARYNEPNTPAPEGIVGASGGDGGGPPGGRTAGASGGGGGGAAASAAAPPAAT